MSNKTIAQKQPFVIKPLDWVAPNSKSSKEDGTPSEKEQNTRESGACSS